MTIPDPYPVLPVKQAIQGEVRPPGSKSITNRAILCAAFASGDSVLSGCLDSVDTRVMIQALRQLGVSIETADQGRTLRITGLPPDQRLHQQTAADVSPQVLNVENSGTTMRFLTAVLGMRGGTYRLEGNARMQQRPIGDLAAALRQFGVSVRTLSPGECPPVELSSSGAVGGECRVRGNISSQYLSGLLLAAPLARDTLKLVVEGTLVSQPYVQMTLEVMRQFGVEVAHQQLQTFSISASEAYQSRDYAIEPDASAASYFWAAAAITGGRVTVQGLTRQSLQGDTRFCDVLQQMGCLIESSPSGLTVSGRPLHGIDIDMNDISDTVQTLAACALFAEGKTVIRGVEHIRHKETDRITDLVRELRRLGAEVEEWADGLSIQPARYGPTTFDTYDDHRMAMSLALVGLRVPGIQIRDPGCTAKTYPEFWHDLARLATPSP